MSFVSRLEWDSKQIQCSEFIVQELKDGAKIPDAIREEFNFTYLLIVKAESTKIYRDIKLAHEILQAVAYLDTENYSSSGRS